MVLQRWCGMIRKLGFLLLLMGLALPGWAAGKPGSIGGYVRSSNGVPQMGASVEVLGPTSRILKLFTDDHGFYSVRDLVPGVYTVKVSAPLFLPALREKVGLRAGSSVMLNITLNTLFEAIQLAPPRGPAGDDDWKWTLRSATNRPVLRYDAPSTIVLASSEAQGARDLKGSLSFVTGSASNGFGGLADMSTGFSLEHSMFSAGTLAFNGNLGYGSGIPDTVLRASYSHAGTNGFQPRVAVTIRHLASPDPTFLHNATLESVSLTTSERLEVGNMLELNFGSDIEAIQFMGHANSFRPFGSADLHLTPDTVLEYEYASSIPDTQRGANSLGSNAGLAESQPRLSVSNFQPALERARHQEVSLSQRAGKTNMQLAFYSDRVSNPALTGVGDLTAEQGNVLPNLYSGTFTFQGRQLSTEGLRVVVQRRILPDLTATLDYAFGGVLELSRPGVELHDARAWLRNERRHAVAVKFGGTIPHAKSRWLASYGWTQGHALTPVDLFNSSPGQSDPYLNLLVRQPLPTLGFLPAHMEAMVDLRNLLAQGYVPVLDPEGRTVYLVQSARSVRGGVAFIF